MDCDMVDYESCESRLRDPEDMERFDKSHATLEAAGIRIRRVVCTA